MNCIVLQEKMKYVYIIGNIFVNTPSISQILALRRIALNVYYTYMKTFLLFLVSSL